MLIGREELIEEIESHIRRSGGGFGEWSIGTAKDCRGPFFRRHLVADLGDELTYREAFTTDVAQAVVDHLVNDRGLALERDAVPAPGRIVFVYRRTRDTGYGARDKGCGIRDSGFGVGGSGKLGAAQGTPQPAPAAPCNAQPTLHKVAA